MKKFISFLIGILIVLTAFTATKKETGNNSSAKVFVSHFENVLGTSLQLKIKAATEEKAALAETVVLKEINRLSKIISGYDKESEFSKWMQTTDIAVPVSKELMEVLNLFDEWKARTGGALDASAQVIAKLWKDAAAQNMLPDNGALQAAVSEVKQLHWILDKNNQTATHLSKAPLLLNSFAKSYIIHHATKAAMAVENVSAVLVNIGGDIEVSGNLAEPVLISNPKASAENDLPMDKLAIANLCVATSGNYRRGELINGQWYSHIVDPRNGLPASQIISATVVAPNATDAGALATAFNILSVEESKELAATIPGAEYLIVTKEGEKITSKGWKNLQLPLAENMSAAPAKPDQWNPDFELLINLELAQLPGFARRPFVAVWVEDKDKNTVRTVSVWYNKDRWLHELRAWYTGNYAKFTGTEATMSTISSATRSAGKYSLKWDGKDDKGNYVKPGKYTIYIEAVREHGSYQLMSEEMNCNGTARQATFNGNAEVASASLDYKKKSNN
ncbi:MAG: hypothetical protein RLZZ28_1728 [Bacteroidota bacterium]